jgi:hypothetical protein
MGTPFKMSGFSGFGNSPVKQTEKKAINSLQQTGKKLMMNTQTLRKQGILKDSIKGMV